MLPVRKIQFILSLIFILAYMILLTIIVLVEFSDIINVNDTSIDGELKLLIGVLTGGVGQIMNFWFNRKESDDQVEPIPSPTAV